MKLTDVISGSPATLMEILDARSRRAERQKELLSGTENGCLISFSLNIAGAIKRFPLALMAFDTGLSEIRGRLKRETKAKILHFEERRPITGPEAMFLLEAKPQDVKRAMTAIEEVHPLGRLFDIDVLGADGIPLSRSQFGLPARACLVCGENAKACARGRVHTIEMVLWCTAKLLDDYFCGQAADLAASCAVKALLYEVSATPKPGLVDRNNSGSHRDMDFFTFVDSSAALIPWFRDFFCIGWAHAKETEEQLFLRLRFAGSRAEADMMAATGGVNTHKGLVFAFAVVCGALGKAAALQIERGDASPDDEKEPADGRRDTDGAFRRSPLSADIVLDICRKLGTCSLGDFAGQNAARAAENHADGRPAQGGETADSSQMTPGLKFQASYGISGARGEAAAGFPSALRFGLPALKKWRSTGLSLNDSAALSLLAILAEVDDTNMIHRGGKEEAARRKEEAARLLSDVTRETFGETLTELDRSYIQGNLSPGGCADLLAVSLMFYFLEECGLTDDFGTFQPTASVLPDTKSR